ncbi:MAG: tungsten ABC transporter substrate-binding protein [Desulfobacca sp. 4484_104]|nr:MAG: tungsten ABC transporter substrate-binding protein [Desulfobacca sp. 4484_104]RLA89507.1 MAG: tungsten ABC transporter substrate-binding protein [Deltaproteobacteria bacterium]
MLLVVGLIIASPAWSEVRIICASTTSTQNSGLFDYLLPIFKQQTGIEVAVVAVGTGQALEMARRGDADVVLVHDPQAEQKFIDEGYGLERRQVMYNDFIIVGPGSDPAQIKGMKQASEAFQKIGQAGFKFISRGDKSGTHSKELLIWEQTGLKPQGQPNYLEAGQGMASTLRMANEKQSYTLVDRGTWLSSKEREPLDLCLLVEGDPVLFNQYSVIVVNPAKIAHAKVKPATQFAAWLVSPAGQKLIGDFKDNKGQQLFHPNAK